MIKVIILLIAIFVGCSESPASFTNTETHRVIRIETDIHIVASRDQFDDKLIREKENSKGYAYLPNGPIWILGRMESGKLVIPDDVLVHEIIHLMAVKDKSIKDPDIGKTKWNYVK